MLDGFPRTIEQAKALNEFAKITNAINIAVDEKLVVDRIAGRRMCKCGESYHVSWYDKDVCAKCGEKLYQRDDDKEETVKSRLEVYNAQTAPLIEYYGKMGILKDVDGAQEMNKVFDDIVRILDDNH